VLNYVRYVDYRSKSITYLYVYIRRVRGCEAPLTSYQEGYEWAPGADMREGALTVNVLLTGGVP